MNSIKFAKEVKKNSVSPLKTPEKTNAYKKPPVLKKSPVKSKQIVAKKVMHGKSLSHIAVIEELKQVSVSIIDGIEKLRRIVAFSKYRPCFEVMKSVFTEENLKIQNFVHLKTKFKIFEILQEQSTGKNEILEVLEEYRENFDPVEDFGTLHYKKILATKAINGMLSYYCQSMEMSQIIQEFYNRKLLHQTFEQLYLTSKYDSAIESYLKVKVI